MQLRQPITIGRGGIAAIEGGDVSFENTIIAGNRVNGMAGLADTDCQVQVLGTSTTTSGGYNILGEGTGCDDDGETDATTTLTAGAIPPSRSTAPPEPAQTVRATATMPGRSSIQDRPRYAAT